jgi:hypothetical protein
LLLFSFIGGHYAQTLLEDNIPLGCKLIDEAATSKAVAVVEIKLQPCYEVRKTLQQQDNDNHYRPISQNPPGKVLPVSHFNVFVVVYNRLGVQDCSATQRIPCMPCRHREERIQLGTMFAGQAEIRATRSLNAFSKSVTSMWIN